MWAAAAPAFPADEGLCLGGRDDSHEQNDAPFYTPSDFGQPVCQIPPFC